MNDKSKQKKENVYLFVSMLKQQQQTEQDWYNLKKERSNPFVQSNRILQKLGHLVVLISVMEIQ